MQPLKGCGSSPHPMAVRLWHLKESSMEPWERLLSSSLLTSASERSCFFTLKSMIHFWTDGAAEPVALFADIVKITFGLRLKVAIEG